MTFVYYSRSFLPACFWNNSALFVLFKNRMLWYNIAYLKIIKAVNQTKISFIKQRILNVLTILLFIYIASSAFSACFPDGLKINDSSQSSYSRPRDYSGYHGCRKNSEAEFLELRADGIDIDEYRATHP